MEDIVPAEGGESQGLKRAVSADAGVQGIHHSMWRIRAVTLITIKKLIIASKLERCYLKVFTYCNYANILGKALNTAKVELAKAKDNFTKLR